MSQWADRIQNHQVWQHLNTLGPAIDQARVREGIEPQTIHTLERIRAVLAFTGKRLAAADPFTTQPTPLDGIATAFQNATSEIQSFIANGNQGHVVNANTHADTALAHLAQTPVPGTPKELAALKDAAVAYRATLEEQLKQAAAVSAQLRVDTDALKAKLTELSADVMAERQRLSQLASEFQSQFSTAQEARNREFTDAQASRQEKYGALIADYTKRLTEQDADFTRQKELALQQHQQDLGKLKEQYAASAEEVLTEIQQRRAQVEKLVGVIGNLGVTSGYLKTANHARLTVWVWQTITVLAMTGIIAVAYKAFVPLVQGTFSWAGFAGRVFLSLTVGVLAAYAASQADKYLEIERRNRKLALELEAIGPYLAPLPQEKQDQFRVDLGQRSFGREEQALGRRSDKSPATVVDVLMKSKEFRDFVTAIVKAARQGS